MAEESEPQWFSRFREATDQRFSRLEAMVADLLCRSRKEEKENPEEQICNDEELAEIEAATKSSGIEDRAVENEANATVISAIDKEEPIPQLQVPVSKLEPSLRFRNASPVVCEDFRSLVGFEGLFDHVKARAESVTKSTSVTNNQVTHQLFDEIPLWKGILPKEHKKRFHKCWRFKFKISSMKARPKLFCFVVDGYKATRIYYGIIGFARFLELCYTLNLFVTQDEGFMESFNNLVCSSWIDEQFERRWSKMICRFEHNENDWIHSLVDTNYCEIWPDKTHVELQEMSCFLSEKSLVGFVGYKAHGRELLVVGVKQLTLAVKKFYLKHKWRSRLLQSFSELKQRIIMSLWKSLGYLMEDMMEEDLKQQGNSEPLVIVPDVDATVELVWESNSLVFHFKTRVWDPGRSLIEYATPREFSFHSTATISFSLLFFLSRITCKFSSLQTLRTRFL